MVWKVCYFWNWIAQIINTIQVGIRTIPQYQGSFKNESVGGKSNKVLKWGKDVCCFLVVMMIVMLWWPYGLLLPSLILSSDLFFDILYRWWRYLWSCFNLERITWSAGLLRTRNYWRGNPLQEEIIDWKAFISPHQLNRERLSQIWWNWTFREKKIAHVLHCQIGSVENCCPCLCSYFVDEIDKST